MLQVEIFILFKKNIFWLDYYRKKWMTIFFNPMNVFPIYISSFSHTIILVNQKGYALCILCFEKMINSFIYITYIHTKMYFLSFKN